MLITRVSTAQQKKFWNKIVFMPKALEDFINVYQQEAGEHMWECWLDEDRVKCEVKWAQFIDMVILIHAVLTKS